MHVNASPRSGTLGGVDLTLDARETAFRDELRGWLEDHVPKERLAGVDEHRRLDQMRAWQRTLAEGRWAVPGWPERLGGRDAGPVELAIYEQELGRAHAPRALNSIGTGWGGAAVLRHGTAEQQDRLLPPVPAGDEVWCQLFSEPNAGSDLASLTTRAVRVDGGWRVEGQKVWSSYAHIADRGILLARTDPAAPRHAGITCFIVDMHQDEITARPIRQITGDADFNEVFFDGALISDQDRVGAEGEGWAVAITTLMSERVGLAAGEGTLWGGGPTFADVLDLWRRRRGSDELSDGVLLRDEVARLAIEGEALRLTGLRLLSGVARGEVPAAEMSVRKLGSDIWGQDVHEAVQHLLGPQGQLEPDSLGAVDGGSWERAYLFSRALTIGGGTTEVQKDILARRILGIG
jgi:3-oxochol-4-en-24-oyl-CoA dehydrogenase